MFGKKKAAMMLAELLGTGILTLVVLNIWYGSQGNSFSVAIGAGMVVAVLTFIVTSISGAHLNPALTLGLWTARKIKTLPAIVYIAIQIAAAGLAFMLYEYLSNSKLPELPKMFHEFNPRIMVAEAAGTFIFVWAWVSAMSRKLEGWQFASAAGLGFAAGILVAGIGTGAFINPAIAFGAQAWTWGTFVLGPVVGAVVAANLHNFLFADRAVATANVVSTKAGATSKVTTKKGKSKK